MFPDQISIPEDTSFPMRGINTYVPSTMLQGGYSPKMNNIEISDNILKKRAGYTLLATISADETLMQLEEFVSSTGTIYFLGFTESHQYKYDTTTGTALWEDISYASAWTGNEQNYIDTAIGFDTTNKWIVITNGVNTPLYWDGAAATFAIVPNLPSSFVAAATVSIFQSRMWFGGLTSTGDRSTIIWSASGDFTDWSGVDTGAIIVAESKGEILALRVLETRLIIYSRDSIIAVSYVGGTVLYAVSLIASGINLLSIGSVAVFDYFHVLLTEGGFFQFNGTPRLIKISDNITKQLDVDLDKNLAYSIQNIYAQEASAIYWIIPTSSSKNLLYILNLHMHMENQFDWFIYELGDSPRCLGYYAPTVALTYDHAAIATGHAYDTFPRLVLSTTRTTYKSMGNNNTFSNVSFGSVKTAFQFDSSVTSDNSSNVSAEWHTPDFVIRQTYQTLEGRWVELEFEAKGDSVDVSYSLDEGLTFTSISTQALTSAWTSYRVWFDVVANHVRFKFSDSSQNDFEVRWVRSWAIPQGVE